MDSARAIEGVRNRELRAATSGPVLREEQGAALRRKNAEGADDGAAAAGKKGAATGDAAEGGERDRETLARLMRNAGRGEPGDLGDESG